jgi:hypothetical protein
MISDGLLYYRGTQLSLLLQNGAPATALAKSTARLEGGNAGQFGRRVNRYDHPGRGNPEQTQ